MNPILFGLTLQTNHATDDKEITWKEQSWCTSHPWFKKGLVTEQHQSINQTVSMHTEQEGEGGIGARQAHTRKNTIMRKKTTWEKPEAHMDDEFRKGTSSTFFFVKFFSDLLLCMCTCVLAYERAYMHAFSPARTYVRRICHNTYDAMLYLRTY
jgi:hypothetical protein